jgi:hypothetical protein
MADVSGNDKKLMAVADEFLELMRKHTNTPADRTVVGAALGIADRMYQFSAPKYSDQPENELSPPESLVSDEAS